MNARHNLARRLGTATDGLRIKTITYPGITIPTENFHGTSRRVLRQTSRLGETRFAYTVTGACITHVNAPSPKCTANCPAEDSWENFQAGWRFYGGQITGARAIDPLGSLGVSVVFRSLGG